MRAFNWVCNLVIFICTCCIVLLEKYAEYAFMVILPVVIVQVAVNGASKLYWKGYYLGYTYSDALYTGQFVQRLRMRWKKWHWQFCTCKKPWKVQPVVCHCFNEKTRWQ